MTIAVLEQLRKEFEPLVGLRIDWLSLPRQALLGFEPSQMAVIANTLLDAALPMIELFSSDPENAARLKQIGLSKAPGQIGERESYPDYVHKSGKRVELKGLFVDNPSLDLKRPPTRREPSARLKENVTMQDVDPANDILLVAAVRLEDVNGRCCPVIIDIELFPMVDCIEARDARLRVAGGRWFGRTPRVVSVPGRAKAHQGTLLTDADFEKDTNFGKLKRIPYPPLQAFMKKHGAI